MRNVSITRSGNIVTITVDLSVKGEISKSGKSIVIGSTEGNKKIEPTPEETASGTNIFLGLNLYKTI
jgi:hypothetical protein